MHVERVHTERNWCAGTKSKTIANIKCLYVAREAHLPRYNLPIDIHTLWDIYTSIYTCHYSGLYKQRERERERERERDTHTHTHMEVVLFRPAPPLKSQVLLSTASFLRIGLSPCLVSRIRWVNASADEICAFSSAPSSRRSIEGGSHVTLTRHGSPSQVLSSAVLPALQLPPHGVRGGENVWSEGGCLDSTIQRHSVTYVLALAP
jgi:hypothetical protein